MKYIEYEEFEVPAKLQDKLGVMAASAQEDPTNNPPATLHKAGVFKWITGLSREGWTPVWAAFMYPFLVFEREVYEEEVEK